MLNVLHLSYSNSGGAGKFANRLHEAQLQAGINSQLLTFNTGGLASSKFEHPLLTSFATFDFQIVRSDIRKPIVSLFRDRVELFRFREHLEPDTILHLHWTPGVINRRTIEQILSTNKVVWTLHDAFPVTGGCHHSLECLGYKTDCTNCPQVKGPFKTQIERNHFRLRQMNRSYEKLILVSPSRWLEKMAKESAITSGAKTFCIPNPIDSKVFYISGEKRQHRRAQDDFEFVIGLCATDLSDPNKNIDTAVEAISQVARRHPLQKFRIIAVGKNINRYILEENVFIHELGLLESDNDLAEIYRSMDVFINPSLQENFPTTLLEALSVGTPCIAWQSGGTKEIVSNNRTGYLVSSLLDLVEAISKVINEENLRRLENSVADSRAAITDIKKCVELYNEAYRFDINS